MNLHKGIVIAAMAGAASILGGCGGSGGSDSTTSNASTDYYSISGTISGLSGSDLVIQNNGGDDYPIATDGSFTFLTTIADGSSYSVTVKTQPAAKVYCNVLNSSGTLSGDAVTNVKVMCESGLYNVVDTGQDKCYDSSTGAESVCSGSGYDGDYAGNQPSYTVSDDGKVVLDNNTGLLWTQTEDLDGNGIINADDKLTQPDAASYCAELDTGGYSWHLPSIKEIYSLIDFRGGDPSGYSGSDTSSLTPFIDDSVFGVGFGDTSAGDRIIDGQVASSTLYVSPAGTISGADTMFGVNFIDGRIKGYPYDYPAENPKTFYVYCVSGNPDYGTNNLVSNEDGTISDNATDLMWEADDYHSSDFEDALDHCEAATTGGWTDWRLPNVKELQSILDYERAPDYTSSAAIDPQFSATSFSNEEGVTDWGYYWSSTTHATYTGVGVSAAYVSFGRALGYFDQGSGLEIVDVHGAGAQRSNNKQSIDGDASSANVGYGTFYYKGPQGDILRNDNRVRCVRNNDFS